jgi:hypothetical protein
MKSCQQRYSGTDFNASNAFMVGAVVFSPAALFLSRPLGFDSFGIALAVCAASLSTVWIRWTQRSSLTVPSIVD